MQPNRNMFHINKTEHSIILDLDQTLIYCYDEDDVEILRKNGIFTKPEYFDIRKRLFKLSLDDVMEKKKGVGVKTVLWGIIRPHVTEFLKFCFNHFKVVTVWSAGKRKYVEAIVDILFKNIKRPHVVFSYDNCERTKNKENKIIKPISKMLQEIDSLDKYMSLQTTFSLDDTEYTFSIPNKENGIKIPAYVPHATPEEIRKDDLSLLKLISWFSQNNLCTDIRNLTKAEIFEGISIDN